MTVTGFGFDEERHWFIIYLDKDLPKGKSIQVSVDFIGSLSSDLTGFYRSSYSDEDTNNATEFLAVTQFEAIGARRAFPCFDEPSFKAVFEVNLGRLRNMTALSNMPIKEEAVTMTDNNEYVWDKFQVTPVMSTYTLAFVISRFTHRESVTMSNGVQVKIWSRNSVSNQTILAQNITSHMLEYFEQLYEIPYPLPKLDVVAIPDFAFTAMENWGLVTFKEKVFRYQEDPSSISQKEIIVSTLAHELAHQWFGNLVTMDWWTE